MTQALRAVATHQPQAPEAGAIGAAAPGPADGDRTGVEQYVRAFERAAPVNDPAWLVPIRREAIASFAQLGFPTTRDEDWHFTSVARIAERSFQPLSPRASFTVTAARIAPFMLGDGEWHTLVFVNGVFRADLSSFASVDGERIIANIGEAIPFDPRLAERHITGIAPFHDNAFTALNTAFMGDGVTVAISPNVVIEKPVHALFVTDGSAEGGLISPRLLVVADHHSSASIVESYVSLDDAATYLTNAVTEVYVAPGARVRHYKVQRESVRAYHVASVSAYQQRDSDYRSFSFAAGADLSRTNISTMLDGEGSHVTLDGLYMVGGSQHVDHQTRIEHAKESCTSHELYKGVLDGRSHGVFNGKVFVRPEAQKTDGKQSNNNLLLSPDARVDTKPQLEIFADDVKCTHGATIGRLDANALFYFESRGIGTERARKLLTYAFAADVLEKIELVQLRERLESLTLERFGVAGD